MNAGQYQQYYEDVTIHPQHRVNIKSQDKRREKEVLADGPRGSALCSAADVSVNYRHAS